MTSAESLAREIAREAGFLPEQQRAWLLGELRKDFEAYDPEEHRLDQLSQRMSEAAQALGRVAQHLKLGDRQARLALTMREFDEAPKTVREGWTSRRVASTIRGSWESAKVVAFTDASLPVSTERRKERVAALARKRREGAFVFTGLKEWLDTDPPRKLRKDYQAWADQQNKNREADRKPLLTGKAIQDRWHLPWAEMVKAVEAGHLPGEEDDAQERDEEAAQQEIAGNLPTPIKRVRFDPKPLIAARKAKGWTTTQLAELAKLDRSSVNKMATGETSNPSFTSVAALAAVLEVPLHSLIVSEN